MRGVLRYRRDDVVAILDSTRAGETDDGVPVVATVEDALPLGPDTALVGVATQGGRFPPAWIELLRSCIANGLDIENGLHVFLADDPELRELAAQHGVELRDLRRPPADLSTATGANLEVPGTIVLTVGSDCAIGKMTVALELDLEARRRGLASIFVPTGQTGIAIAGWGIAVDAVVADFIAGAAERLVVEGVAPRRRAALGRGPGLDHPSGLLGRHARPLPRERAAPASALPRGGAHRDRGRGRRPAPDPAAARARRAARAASRCPRDPLGSPQSRSTRGRSTRPRRGPRSRRPRRRPACRPTIPSVSAPGRFSTPSPSSPRHGPEQGLNLARRRALLRGGYGRTEGRGREQAHCGGHRRACAADHGRCCGRPPDRFRRRPDEVRR